MYALSFTLGLIIGAAATLLVTCIRCCRQRSQMLQLIHDCRHLHPANTLERLKKLIAAEKKRRL